MQLSKKELTFLQKHKENFNSGNLTAILNDYKEFGSYNKLSTLLNSLDTIPGSGETPAAPANPVSSTSGPADWSGLYDKLMNLYNSL